MSGDILPERPPRDPRRRPPYFRPLGEFECNTCGAVITVPDPEKPPEIIDGICISYGVNFDEWLREQGWIRHYMVQQFWDTLPNGKRQKCGSTWTEWECANCAGGVLARKGSNQNER